MSPARSTPPPTLPELQQRLSRGEFQSCLEALTAWLAHSPAPDRERAHALLLLARAHHAISGHAEQQLEIALQAASLAEAHQAPALQAHALCVAAAAHFKLGLASASSDLALQALGLARQCENEAAQAEALRTASWVPLGAGEYAEAAQLLEQSVICAQASEDAEQIFWSLNMQAHMFGLQAIEHAGAGDSAAASARAADVSRVAHQCLAVARHHANPLQQAFGLANLADAYIVTDDVGTARPLIQSYRELAAGIGYKRLLAYANLDDARLARSLGHWGDALAALESPDHLDCLAQNEDIAVTTAKTRYELYKLQGLFERALACHEDYLSRQVSALNQRFESQQRVLLARIDLEQARAAAETARLEAQTQRARAAVLRHERDLHRHASLIDTLTGLGNRRAADEDLAALLQGDTEQRRQLWAAFVDVDHFKRVNDSLGHASGDAVLVGLARLMTEVLRDHVYRFGGEEFLVLLDGASAPAALEICERLRRAVQAADWGQIAPGLRVTVSVGLTARLAADTPTSLLARADQALYRAKHLGRDRIERA